jgi:putative DNA primase/helicase
MRHQVCQILQAEDRMSSIAQACVGRWPAILIELGIDQSFLKNQHGPCPACGGKDRFRFDDKAGKGSYFCSGCGAGDGFSLLQKVNGWSFAEAANRIEEVIGKCHAAPAPTKADDGHNEARLERVHTGLARITHNDVAGQYLLSRGITILPKKNVYFHPGIVYWHKNDAGKPVKVGTFPAMVSMFRNIANEVCTFHITYLTRDGQKISEYPAKKFLPKIRDMAGGAIQLGGVGETLGIAEGIETALAAMQNDGYPCWAAANVTLLEQVEVPDYVRTVIIYADNDSSFTGQKAAYTLANRLKVKKGKEVYVASILGKEGPVHIDRGLNIDYVDYIQKHQ